MEELTCFLSFHHLHHHSQHHYLYHHHHFHHDDFWASNTSRLLNLFEVNNMKNLNGHLLCVPNSQGCFEYKVPTTLSGFIMTVYRLVYAFVDQLLVLKHSYSHLTL